VENNPEVNMNQTVIEGQLQFSENLPRVNEFKRFIRVFTSRGLVKFGIFIIVLLFVTAIFAPVLAPHDPYQQNLDNVLQPPSLEHPLGTDSIGRDTLSRIIYGSRLALLIGIGSVALAALIGTVIGLFAGYLGGWIEVIIMRIIDALMAFPPLLLALAISVLLDAGVANVMIAIVISMLPGFTRMTAAQVRSIKEEEYVMAARSIGCSNMHIMFRQILPNCFSPLIVQMTMSIGGAILAEAMLSFLGVGILPPAAAWGYMVNDGNRYLVINPLLAITPGFCIMLVVFAFNMVGDGLRDALDPRLRGVL
jgi:peptide/nickel transport system permease protein